MIPAPIPANDAARVQALRALAMLDAGPDATLDRATRLAARLMNTPHALVTLVDADRQVFKARYDCDLTGSDRAISFCGHAIAQDQPLVVTDALLDARFADNPLVVGPPSIRFYAGVPLHTLDHYAIGTLCVFDTQPHVPDAASLDALIDLARLLQQSINLRELELRNTATHGDKLRQAQDEVDRRQKRLADTLETALEAFIGTAEDGRILAWNQAATDLTGWSAEEIKGQRYQDFLLIPEDRLAAATARDEFIREGRTTRAARRETEVLRKDGRRIAVEMTVSPIADGEQILFNLFMHDISARKHAEAALRQSREELQTIADNLPVLIGYIDADYRVGYVNAIWREWFGKDPSQVSGRPLQDALGPDLWLRAKPLLDKGLQGLKLAFESTVPIRNGERTLRLTVIPDDDHQGQTRGVYMMIIDISDRKRLEERLQREALEDPLTGLPNRRAILRRIEEACVRQTRHPNPVALFFLDLDGFKGVNDRFGHDAGDEVLREFARRLREAVRANDVVARLAGDEFTVLLEDLHDERDAAQVASKIVGVMRAPFVLHGEVLHLSTSIGIALRHPHQPANPGALIDAADAAMYAVKRAGKNNYGFARDGDG
ncbi:sensor domain-containing diguanylate cyclase [Amantichitinum ursilacus]|uniref:Response regulator PleD n=1 Tax=Amantichitinum ursilacus TaxID=857265 RepID=A0A0N0XLG4_9NEIS|nr:diguanylate cyclase [Amantichitinum ursilacus]KPC55183.1 Response regulator PleD [Amantichitinum ursilacus]